jgi:2-keto-3-deoxy-L-rhamnonate aldolase RhmA
MNFSFKEKLHGPDPLLGVLLSLPTPEVAEMISKIGFDWVFIDAEHSALGFREIQYILQALAPGCAGIVRVPLLDEIWIKKVLDLGAEGIIVPQIKTVEEVRTVVRLCKYPLAGTRSIGISRAHDYGLAFNEYLREANDKLVIIIQLEHVDAFRNIDEILAEEGYDAIFIGPYDYSASAGKTGQVNDPEIQEQIDMVRGKCFRKKMPVGIFGVSAEAVKPYICQGYTLIAAGIDLLLLKDAATASYDILRKRSF